MVCVGVCSSIYVYVVVTCMYRRVWSLGSMYNVHRAKANAKNKLPYIHISIHVNLPRNNFEVA